jgi:hypothetical protein
MKDSIMRKLLIGFFLLCLALPSCARVMNVTITRFPFTLVVMDSLTTGQKDTVNVIIPAGTSLQYFSPYFYIERLSGSSGTSWFSAKWQAFPMDTVSVPVLTGTVGTMRRVSMLDTLLKGTSVHTLKLSNASDTEADSVNIGAATFPQIYYPIATPFGPPVSGCWRFIYGATTNDPLRVTLMIDYLKK